MQLDSIVYFIVFKQFLSTCANILNALLVICSKYLTGLVSLQSDWVDFRLKKLCKNSYLHSFCLSHFRFGESSS